MKILIKFAVVASLLMATGPVAALCKWRESDGDAVSNLNSCYKDLKDYQRQGRWQVQFSDGTVWVGPFVNGKKHGRWEERDADGTIETGPYVNGELHGIWEEIYANGDSRVGRFVHDKRQGQTEYRWSDGRVACETYINDEKVDDADGPCPDLQVADNKSTTQPATDLPAATNSAATVFDSVWRSVVYIADDDGQGSGVIVGRDTVATNCHVVTAKKIGVFPPATREATADEAIRASVLHRDKKRDFCLLRVAGVGGRIAKIRKFNTLKIGEAVYAIGAPEGQELTLSDGLISQLRRRDGRRLIQTNAAISHGSSGGGLFDARGNLIGITTAVITADDAANIGFAIPAELALGK